MHTGFQYRNAIHYSKNLSRNRVENDLFWAGRDSRTQGKDGYDSSGMSLVGEGGEGACITLMSLRSQLACWSTAYHATITLRDSQRASGGEMWIVTRERTGSS